MLMARWCATRGCGGNQASPHLHDQARGPFWEVVSLDVISHNTAAKRPRQPLNDSIESNIETEKIAIAEFSVQSFALFLVCQYVVTCELLLVQPPLCSTYVAVNVYLRIREQHGRLAGEDNQMTKKRSKETNR